MSSNSTTGHKQTTTNFSLKDQLFNKGNVTVLAARITAVHPEFEQKKFVKDVLDKFPELELKARIFWIRECLHTYLPSNYRSAVKVLLASLPEECNPALSDDDFGEFIYAPYGYFIAEYGCTKQQLKFSLAAIEQMTTRFSCEDPIRFFINAFPEETMQQLQKWATYSHYHVRRLASEGTRPKLPWALGISLEPTAAIPILNKLYADNTRYVTRSVANHLNDISKTDPDMVIETLQRWKKAKQQIDKEMQFIIKHSVRTLVKKGHSGAMQLLGFSTTPKILVQDFVVSEQVTIGKKLMFYFTVEAKQDEQLLIDYVIKFNTKSGKLGTKVFKLKQLTLKTGESITLSKEHPFKIMTTRTLYPGIHSIALQINGQLHPAMEFTLVA